MSYFSGVIVGILIYSTILTILTVYKDNSSYFIVSTLDVVMAGPVCWVTILLLHLTGKVYVRIRKKAGKEKPKQYRPKSQKKIEKIVRKVVQEFKKKNDASELYFDFRCKDGDDYGNYEGYDMLLVKNPVHERLNNQFMRLLWNQTEEVHKELSKYFEPLTEERMMEDEYDDWTIEDMKSKELMVLKKD